MKDIKNEKGFAIAGIVYSLLVLFLIVIMLTLGLLMTRKNIINKYTKKAQVEIYERLSALQK